MLGDDNMQAMTQIRWKHTKPPKNCNHKNNIYVINFFGNVWTSHLGFFCLFEVYMISFILNLINYFEKSNKHWRIWTYGIYLWQDNTHRVWKFEYILQNQSCEWNSWVNFSIVYDIDIHQLNLEQFKN
jgi:hypothetical protein